MIVQTGSHLTHTEAICAQRMHNILTHSEYKKHLTLINGQSSTSYEFATRYHDNNKIYILFYSESVS